MRLAICLLLLCAFAEKIEYSPVIYGLIEGARLVDKVSVKRCTATFSRERGQISFDSLISDTIYITKTCNWPSAAKTLLKFRTTDHYDKAAAEISSFLLTILNNPQKNDGLTIGKVLEYRIDSISPYVLKFEYGKKASSALKASPYPVAIFHGLGDCCCFPGMIEFTRYLGKEANTFSKCVEVGDGPAATWLMGFQKQVNAACASMVKIPEFQNGVNVVGLSQGGLIARAMAEMCNITVHNVITLGGPHMGVMSIPNCETGFYCEIFNDALDLGVYDSFVQDNFGPPGYFKDQFTYQEYLQKSGFLAAANNEKSINPAYASGFKAINQFVMIDFTEDTIVDPIISEQFGYFKNNSKTDLLLYNQTGDYLDDILGLKTLDQQGKLVFESIVGNHLQFNETDIDRTVIPYLV